MTEPKLSIGIPTLDRAQYLERAINSVLRGHVPAKIIVADQGHTSEVAKVMERFRDNPVVQHLQSPAACLAENWTWAARQADTEYFAWLQDDDVVGKHYAARILAAFDAHPDADCWMARLCCAYRANDRWFASWFLSNGPWTFMEILDIEDGAPPGPGRWPGEIMVPTAYFTSWALSPAVAFRCGPAFDAALSRMPTDCDLYAERLILAGMGVAGPIITDPSVVGYWVQHEGNESKRQHKDQARQTEVMIEWVDQLMDEPGVADRTLEALNAWCSVMPTGHLALWVDTMKHQPQGRYHDRIGSILLDHIQRDVGPIAMPGGTSIAGIGDGIGWTPGVDAFCGVPYDVFD